MVEKVYRKIILLNHKFKKLFLELNKIKYLIKYINN